MQSHTSGERHARRLRRHRQERRVRHAGATFTSRTQGAPSASTIDVDPGQVAQAQSAAAALAPARVTVAATVLRPAAPARSSRWRRRCSAPRSRRPRPSGSISTSGKGSRSSPSETHRDLGPVDRALDDRRVAEAQRRHHRGGRSRLALDGRDAERRAAARRLHDAGQPDDARRRASIAAPAPRSRRAPTPRSRSTPGSRPRPGARASLASTLSNAISQSNAAVPV